MNLDVEKIIREYIDKTVHMSLATVSDNKPWVCEVHFAYDENLNLYFVSKLDTRHCQEIAKIPNVAGNIVAQHGLTDAPHGIYFEGHAKQLTDPAEEQLVEYCSRLKRDLSELKSFLSGGERAMFKIEVKNWAAFGEFNGVKTQKHILEWSGGKK